MEYYETVKGLCGDHFCGAGAGGTGVCVLWYFLVAVPAKKAEQSGTFVMVPVPEMEVCRGTVTGVLKTIGDMDRKPWSA
ncbi:MAG: hypothetical protein ACLUAR_17325 [Pilosibacter sp.]